jgi:hypothetical protein
VAGAGDDPVVLEAGLFGQFERYRYLKQLGKGRAAQIRIDQLIGRKLAVARGNQGTFCFFVWDNFRDSAGVLIKPGLNLRKQSCFNEGTG